LQRVTTDFDNYRSLLLLYIQIMLPLCMAWRFMCACIYRLTHS